ncbi:hypothetical protein C0Q70_03996 [Pomacea canaliculata]|uniref:Urease accessory protein UreF n=2 Tax=Pomacea canaliculata TaxID=400727 RepID=A0A2T7PUA1_POMCA|nr:hypothetical protein C0Q70_03996 [Pomacea canaliculata]
MGLESAVQHHWVQSKGDLINFCISVLENAGSLGIPFVQESFKNYADVKHLSRLDQLLHACSANHVACRASTKQGKAMLETASRVFMDQNISKLLSSLSHCHHAVVFGAICGCLGIAEEIMLATYMSGLARTVMASAVRLDKVGPIEAQKIVASLQKVIPEIIHRLKIRTTQEACITYPVLDILQNCHDRLFCKLFNS